MCVVLESRNVTPVFPLSFSLAVRAISQERNPRKRQGIPVFYNIGVVISFPK